MWTKQQPYIKKRDFTVLWWTAGDVAFYCDVSKETVRRWALGGILPYTKTPTGIWLFTRDEVKLLKQKRDSASALPKRAGQDC